MTVRCNSPRKNTDGRHWIRTAPPAAQEHADQRAPGLRLCGRHRLGADDARIGVGRSGEHTSELQSLTNLVCRLLLEKKNKAILQGSPCLGHGIHYEV